MDVRVGLWRKLSTEELMLLNCGVREDSWKSLGLQGDPTSPSQRRSVLGVHWKDRCRSWNSNTLATSCKDWLTGKDSDAGRDWGQEEKGTTDDEMAGWHHRLDGLEFALTLGVCDGQEGLACCGSWGCKESDTTEWLSWTDKKYNSANSSQLQVYIHSTSDSIRIPRYSSQLSPWIAYLCKPMLMVFKIRYRRSG